MNQIIHFTVSYITTVLALKFTHYRIFAFSGILLGVMVELFQYLYMDDLDLKLIDRSTDLFFWGIANLCAWWLHSINTEA